MGTAWLNIALIKSRIEVAAREELDVIGSEIAEDARRRAPIRKVFKERKGFKRKFRPLTEGERSLAIARANNYYTNIQPNEFKRRRALAHLRNYARVELPRRSSANALHNSRNLRQLGVEHRGRFTGVNGSFRVGRGIEPGDTIRPLLTSRGAHEIRSGRAVFRAPLASGGTRVQAGGALKASIESEGVTQSPTGLIVRITAAIRYAKYVEFPTIRTAAQPFMRPALHAARASIPRRLAAAIGRALRG